MGSVCVSWWIISKCFGFVSHSKDLHVRLIGDSKLALSMGGCCYGLLAMRWTGDLSRLCIKSSDGPLWHRSTGQSEFKKMDGWTCEVCLCLQSWNKLQKHNLYCLADVLSVYNRLKQGKEMIPGLIWFHTDDMASYLLHLEMCVEGLRYAECRFPLVWTVDLHPDVQFEVWDYTQQLLKN